ncbi:MAG: InlB B-repeat-containing protein, partial [Acetatifactor sp.]
MRNTTKRFWMRIVGFCLVLLLGSSTALSVRAAGDKDSKSDGTKIESETATSIRLMKTEGTVAVEKSSGKSVKLIKNMKLFDGYRVSTEEKSYAWEELDKTKLIKEDALSEVEIRKSGKVLEVLLNSGNLYFNVTEKLDEDETMNICTSSMIAGIRGTSGWVEAIDSRHSRITILDGRVECTVTDPVTGQMKTATITAGQRADLYVDREGKKGEKCDIQLGQFAEKDVPGFVAVELAGNKQHCEKIYSASGIDLRNLTKQEAAARLQEDQEIVAEKQREIENQIAQQENNISKDPVWEREITPVKKPSQPQNQTPAQTEPESPAPSVPETPANPSVPATPSTPDAAQVSVTDPDGISGILATGQDVVVSPDSTSNIYQIDSDLHIPSGTTLTVDSGVTMIVGSAATVTVDGTLLAKGDAENEGKIIVNSSESFHITGAMTNRGTIVNQASGLIEAAEGIDNYGAISCDGTSTLYSSSADGTVRMRGTASTLVVAGGDITNKGTGAALALDEASQIGNITFTTDTLLQSVTANVLTVGGQKLDVDSYEVTFDSASNLYQFKIDVKTVTFDGGEGSTVKQVKVITGFAVGSGVPALTREGYELTGWNTASDGSGESFTAQTVVTEDLTVYAQWSSNETIHTVTLDPNGGTLQTGNLLETVHNGTVELPVPLAPENYAFYGWFTAKDSTGVKVTGAEPITADVTYYARWVPASTALQVDFCIPGEVETVLETQYVVSGGTAVQPADPEKEGYTFEGWYQDSTLEKAYLFDTPVTESIRLYAKFTINSYNVSFESFNGAEPYIVSVWYGYTVTAPETDPVKEGYTFVGWYEDETCTKSYDFYTAVT